MLTMVYTSTRTPGSSELMCQEPLAHNPGVKIKNRYGPQMNADERG
jgi:hypothetical protein